MCKEEHAKKINRSVFPGMQGGPHDHITAAKAVAFKEAFNEDFKSYAKNVIKNAKTLAVELKAMGYTIISGGTDNHLMVIDLRSKDIVGKDVETVLESIGISVSRSTIPNDPNPPYNPSGVRIGTPAVTSRGMGGTEMKRIAAWINGAIEHKDEPIILDNIKKEVKEVCLDFPIPSL